MAKIFGDFVDKDAKDQEYLLIGFSPTSIPLRQRWRNNGLSAGFLSDYVICFFPGEDTDSAGRREAAKSAVSYIANELLENAMKFTHAPSEYPVTIGMHLDRNQLRFYVTNSVDAEAERCLRTTDSKAADRRYQRVVHANNWRAAGKDEARGPVWVI